MVRHRDQDSAQHLGGAGHPDGAGWKLPKQLRVPRRCPQAGGHGLREDPGAMQGPDQEPQEAVPASQGGQPAKQRAVPQDLQVLRHHGEDPEQPAGPGPAGVDRQRGGRGGGRGWAGGRWRGCSG